MRPLTVVWEVPEEDDKPRGLLAPDGFIHTVAGIVAIVAFVTLVGVLLVGVC